MKSISRINYHSRMQVAILCFCLFFSFSALACAEPSDSERLARLNADFKTVEANSVTNRVLNVLIGTLEGGAFIAYGVLFFNSEYFGTTDVTKVAQGVFIGLGVAAFVMGFVFTFIPTEFETLPQQYNAMPQSSEEDIQAKVAFGESTLEKLRADSFNIRRINIIGGAIVGGFSLWHFIQTIHMASLLPSLTSYLTSGLIFYGVGSAIMVTVSLISILVESVPEKQAAEYQRWKAGASSAGESAALSQIAFKAWGVGAEISISF